jgi:amino acid adenylation domain-containing protein
LIPDNASLFYDVFRASYLAHPQRPALCVDGASLTYRELYERAIHLATIVRDSRAEYCALLVNRTVTAYAAVLASLAAGTTYVPLNPRLPTERLRHILAASGAKTIIIDRRSMAAASAIIPAIEAPLTIVLPDALPSWPRHFRHHYLTQADIEKRITDPVDGLAADGAYLLFTSGSTGVPKGIRITHRNVLAYLSNVSERYRPSVEERFTQLFDLSFDLSVHDMFLCWSAGACLCVAPEGIAGLGDYIRKRGITYWFSVPTTAGFMASMHLLKSGAFPTIRCSLFCGEALPVTVARAWQQAAPNSFIDNLYGPTEATIALTAYRLPPVLTGDTVPIGHPFPGQEVAIIDAQGHRLPPGVAGELCLGGSQVAEGYWQDLLLTKERFQGPDSRLPWFRTGDRAVMTEEGLVFLGRMDRQVKLRGHRIELDEVEAALRNAAATETVAALPSLGREVVAAIVGFVAGSPRPASDILTSCRRLLPHYMVPSEIRVLSHWPCNANGKTDYPALQRSMETRCQTQ